MQKQEPRIIVGAGTTSEELLQWMTGKVEAASLLSESLKLKDHREVLASGLDARIEDYTRLAAIEVLTEKLTPLEFWASVEDPAPDLLLVSSEILKVIKKELEHQGVQPTSNNIRNVFRIIDCLLGDPWL